MTPEPCPTCKGFCCGSLYHDEWGAPPLRFGHVRPATHTCPDCDDGTYEVCGDPEPFIPERSFKDERADVVAWLNYARSYDAIASARFIASGGHVGWSKKSSDKV